MHLFKCTYITCAAHTIRYEDVKKMIQERSALISFARVSYQRIARTLHIELEMCAYHTQTLCRHACDENGLHYNERHGWLSRVIPQHSNTQLKTSSEWQAMHTVFFFFFSHLTTNMFKALPSISDCLS